VTAAEDSLAGVVLRPDDPGYAEAVRVWNGGVVERPALVVQPGDAAGVAAAVRYASAQGLALSVRGGGHHIAGTSLVDGGLTVDLSRLTRVTVDPAAGTATVGGGCRLKDVDRETQRHGLAVPLGFISDVGVGGLTLGGGLGYLTRRFGWTVDSLLDVEIVTADGTIRRAAHDSDPDLFWAVRGAGANFGVVTRFTFRLHPVGPTVHGGLVAWPFERSAELMAAYRRITTDAPRELSVWLVLLHGPPAPFVPADWQGRKLCGMAVCYSGDPAGATTALAPIRALGEPVFDLIGEMPYTAVQSYLDDTEPSGMHYHWRTEYLTACATCSRHVRTPWRTWASCTWEVRSTNGRRTTARSGTATSATWSASRACGAPVIRRRPVSGTGCASAVTGSAPSGPAAPTSTSRPPTSRTSGCVPPTAATTAAWRP
jgi:hypothetical protein